MRWLAICVIIVVVGFMAYVRLVPADAEKLHRAGVARDAGDYPTAGSFTAVRALTTPPDGVLTALLRAAEQTPRTQLIIGDVTEQLLTFETRSGLMRFPDYTTVSIIDAGAAPDGNEGPLLMIRARSRFGYSDLGVNRARVMDWLARLGPLVVAP